jgi:23S rRNA (pseudouridine1915-N3)-methyltransferase
MEIEFCLTWSQAGRSANKAFKHIPAYQMFSEYVDRISKLIPCRITGAIQKESSGKGAKLWICDRGTGALSFTSEALAARFEKLIDSGVRKLQIAIGGSDGFSELEIKHLNPDLKWSFGPMTLPHELASVVAGEQIYRALTIIRKMPYHLGH